MFFGGLPPGFEDAFGGGGMPGGMGGRRPRGPVNNSKYYEVRPTHPRAAAARAQSRQLSFHPFTHLSHARSPFFSLGAQTLGVEKDASPDVIKKAYRKLAVKNHPDKGGDEAVFKEIQKAFDVLSDERKREIYDQGGEEAIEQGDGGGGGPGDIFDVLGGRNRGRQQSRVKKGENMVHPLKVTLEQIYKGSARTLRLTRKVIDKQKGVEQCSSCGGRGAKIQTIRMGPMIQQVQKTCDDCGGKGVMYRQQKVQETLDVHVPKGAPDGHKIHFSEKADEIPDGEAGDVVFVLQEQPHPMYKRKGDDLFLERTISLSEALCGFKMELDSLDGRKLLIKNNPGEVIKPVTYDPFREDNDDAGWEMFEDSDCPSLDNAAVAETEDLNVCKKAVAKGQLKGKGIGCFVQRGGKTVFKQCTTEQALSSKTTSRGAKLFVLQDPESTKGTRMMKAVSGEGLPRLRSPFEHGNMFITFTIEFPDSIPAGAAGELLKLLGPPKHVPTVTEETEDVDVCELTDVDPVSSFKEYIPAENDEDDEEGGPGGQRVQCAQQ